MDRFDLVVLGAGPGAKMIWGSVPGRTIAVVERGLVGGDCPFLACVPSKTMLREARLWTQAADPIHAPLIINRALPQEAFAHAAARRDAVVHNRDDTAAAAALKATGATLRRGSGTIVRPGVVAVDGDEIGYRELVIDTGSQPARPRVDGMSTVDVWTTEEALSTREQPRRLLVIGGGPAGVELAFLYATLGTEVTVAEGAERLVSREEPEASAALRDLLTQTGATVCLGTQVSRLERHGLGVTARLTNGDTVEADRVLLAAGRRPRTAGLGLDRLGVSLGEKGEIAVDARCRVRGADHVWAVGDATGIQPNTHVAHYQGRVVAANLRGEALSTDYRAMPRVIYTTPVVASVGHTLASATAAGLKPLVARAPMSDPVRSTTEGDSRGWLMLVADPARGVLVGATAVGGYAEEWISEISLAIRADVPVWVAAHVVHPFPTYGEVLEDPLWRLSAELLPRHPPTDGSAQPFTGFVPASNRRSES